MSKLYATVGDTVEEFVNKQGIKEARTVEGPIVIKDIEVEVHEFAAKYSAIQALYPGSIVRYMKEPR